MPCLVNKNLISFSEAKESNCRDKISIFFLTEGLKYLTRGSAVFKILKTFLNVALRLSIC